MKRLSLAFISLVVLGSMLLSACVTPAPTAEPTKPAAPAAATKAPEPTKAPAAPAGAKVLKIGMLATKSGGVNELVQPGINGWLVDIDAPALANGMRAMLANADATRALGERAPHTIQNRTWASVTEELLAVFENALSHIQP